MPCIFFLQKSSSYSILICKGDFKMRNICSLKLNNIVRKSKATLLSIFAPLISLAESVASAININVIYFIFEKNT